MTHYRRIYTPGATWFFTVNSAKRRNNRLWVENIDVLRTAFYDVKNKHPFRIEAVVIMPIIFIASGLYLRVMLIIQCVEDGSKGAFPVTSIPAKAFLKAGKNGASADSGNAVFGRI